MDNNFHVSNVEVRQLESLRNARIAEGRPGRIPEEHAKARADFQFCGATSQLEAAVNAARRVEEKLRFGSEGTSETDDMYLEAGRDSE